MSSHLGIVWWTFFNFLLSIFKNHCTRDWSARGLLIMYVCIHSWVSGCLRVCVSWYLREYTAYTQKSPLLSVLFVKKWLLFFYSKLALRLFLDKLLNIKLLLSDFLKFSTVFVIFVQFFCIYACWINAPITIFTPHTYKHFSVLRDKGQI